LDKARRIHPDALRDLRKKSKKHARR
jgi:hypothetical protein